MPPRTAQPARSALLAAATVAVAAALAAVGCDRAAGPVLPGEVQAAVAPPTLAPVSVVPPAIDRSVVTRVPLRDPTSLAATQVDLHRQSDGVVDILWIVDTTGSMANQRTSLANNFDRFIDTLTQLRTDFRIGVTSTDMSRTGERGELRGAVKIIDNDTPDPQAVFRANTTFPSSRKRWMQSLRAMETALDPGGPNPGFLRAGAALAVIVVSDGDDESPVGTAYYARRLRSLKGPGYENLVSFSAIAGTLPDGCWPPGEEAFFGSKAQAGFRLSDMARRTGGVFASICDEGFELSLTRIAQALNTLKRIFPLTLTPDPTTLAVLVDGVPVAADPISGWEYRQAINSVAFPGDYVPAPGAFVQIFYAIAQEE